MELSLPVSYRPGKGSSTDFRPQIWCFYCHFPCQQGAQGLAAWLDLTQGSLLQSPPPYTVVTQHAASALFYSTPTSTSNVLPVLIRRHGRV